jgi:DNA-binding protein HU-beta
MKKSELIERVAEKAQTSKAAAARVVDAIFDTASGAIAEAMRAGQQVSIPGFGKFRPKERAARKGRNPRTGREIQIPKSTVVSFTAGKGLKDAVSRKAGAKKTAAKASGNSKKPAAKATKKATKKG